MTLREFTNQFNISAECKKYGVGLWQCPQFLFFVMGTVIVFVLSIVNYLLINNYISSPEVVALASLIVTAVSFIVSFAIMKGFETLAQANRMKSEFVSIVSHQLRAPLSNLKWAIELLMSEEINSAKEKQQEYFDILNENSNRMQELISDLLIVSRMENTDFFSKPDVFSLEELTRDTIKRFDVFARSSNILINLEVQEKLPNAFANISNIKLVVENFIDNAIRYIKKSGEIKIKISSKDKKILFEIEDDGVGIPKEDQKYIFQKFFRAKNVLKYQTQGSGLGLYICKNIIEKSGGKIGFDSKENQSSKFWFTVPSK